LKNSRGRRLMEVVEEGREGEGREGGRREEESEEK